MYGGAYIRLAFSAGHLNDGELPLAKTFVATVTCPVLRDRTHIISDIISPRTSAVFDGLRSSQAKRQSVGGLTWKSKTMGIPTFLCSQSRSLTENMDARSSFSTVSRFFMPGLSRCQDLMYRRSCSQNMDEGSLQLHDVLTENRDGDAI